MHHQVSSCDTSKLKEMLMNIKFYEALDWLAIYAVDYMKLSFPTLYGLLKPTAIKEDLLFASDIYDESNQYMIPLESIGCITGCCHKSTLEKLECIMEKYIPGKTICWDKTQLANEIEKEFCISEKYNITINGGLNTSGIYKLNSDVYEIKADYFTNDWYQWNISSQDIKYIKLISNPELVLVTVLANNLAIFQIIPTCAIDKIQIGLPITS